ncbi:MAG TPA: FHA domain-containing protein [Propionibacteriaceae bacterium]|nr:FHA domain-containing protein [Propionibacteriaceae bacterium]
MIAVCPAGHSSLAQDYCDVCGLAIDPEVAPASTLASTAQSATTGSQPGRQPCPNCGTDNSVDALFCENCGYDFTTGTMPRPLAESVPAGATAADQSPATQAVSGTAGNGSQAPETFDWVAEVWIDPAWYEAQQSPDPMPSPGLPVVVPLRSMSILVGRMSRSRNIHPQIDCEPDSGVSRRQSQLTTDGSRWWVEDLDSANGTFVAAATDPIPSNPIPVGVKHELASDDRIYLGAWTRIVIRRATEDEKASLS